MNLGYKLKHYFFSAFRELFVHHHGSLEFRAKVFALVLSANDQAKLENYEIIKDLGMHIYDGDKNRADFLMLSTKELVQKVREDNGLDVDSLIASIQNDLKVIPRFAKKIDIKALKPLLSLSHDADIISYQENILEFLQAIKDETLNTNKL